MDLGIKAFGETSSSIFSQDRKLWTRTIWEEHLQDWLVKLIEENKKLRQTSSWSLGRVFEPHLAQLIMGLTSEYTKVEPHIFYSALDLYDRFSTAHVHELAQYVMGHFKGKELEKALRDVKRRVRQQAFLRVLSCVQLACKMNTNKKTFRLRTIQKLLFKAGFPFHQNSITKSEIRVLEELKFRCSVASSPLVYVGVLLALATSYPQGLPKKKDGSDRSKGPKIKGNSRARGRKAATRMGEALEEGEGEKDEDSDPPMYYVGGKEKVPVSKLYHTSALVLEAAHLKHGAVYKRVFKQVTGSEVMSRRSRRAFAKVVADRLLLSGSSVVAAAWLFGDSVGDSMAQSIANHTAIPMGDLQVFAACILHETVGITLQDT